jgi:hypothetical protein
MPGVGHEAVETGPEVFAAAVLESLGDDPVRARAIGRQTEARDERGPAGPAVEPAEPKAFRFP